MQYNQFPAPTFETLAPEYCFLVELVRVSVIRWLLRVFILLRFVGQSVGRVPEIPEIASHNR